MSEDLSERRSALYFLAKIIVAISLTFTAVLQATAGHSEGAAKLNEINK